jgi:Uma2 family endonuclease
MASNPKTYLTPEEYLELERKAEGKSEYFNGEIFAMGGASPRHLLTTANIVTAFHVQLRGRHCGVFSSNQRVKVPSIGFYAYPDVLALCGRPEFDDQQQDTLLNPQVIIEVLSNSTKDYDRGEKFEHYRSIQSLSDYVVITDYKIHVEHFSKKSTDSWILKETNDREDSIRVTLWNHSPGDAYLRTETTYLRDNHSRNPTTVYSYESREPKSIDCELKLSDIYANYDFVGEGNIEE